jgi:hypothetical protein
MKIKQGFQEDKPIKFQDQICKEGMTVMKNTVQLIEIKIITDLSMDKELELDNLDF